MYVPNELQYIFIEKFANYTSHHFYNFHLMEIKLRKRMLKEICRSRKQRYPKSEVPIKLKKMIQKEVLKI